MRKTTGFLIILAMGIAVFVLTEAGDVEPPGPPAPTMVTLQQIYDLYPGGPAKSACRVAGLPRPDSCV